MWHSWMRAVSASGTSSAWSQCRQRRLPCPAEHADRDDPHLARRRQRAHHVGRAAGGGDAEQHVAAPAEAAQRPLEHPVVAVVVAAGGQHRRIQGQRQGRPSSRAPPSRAGGSAFRSPGAGCPPPSRHCRRTSVCRPPRRLVSQASTTAITASASSVAIRRLRSADFVIMAAKRAVSVMVGPVSVVSGLAGFYTGHPISRPPPTGTPRGRRRTGEMSVPAGRDISVATEMLAFQHYCVYIKPCG